ncbi:putative 40S ribosomal protein S29 [Scophthalmus maximus]|uniref:Small ribosomal subunit protein uS14 n=1 Tax=Scophthalmus maximus TaxID=52904 RepID=A0A2U9CVY3_SCOMX|nr:putative 40S ribosomal protein S29 [Scophthalmus maximus]
MGHQQLYWSHPRKFGQGSRSCRVCSNRHGLIRKYGLNMCRQCFRQYAKDIGFVKASISVHAVTLTPRPLHDPPPPVHHLNSRCLVMSHQTVQPEALHETSQLPAPFLIARASVLAAGGEVFFIFEAPNSEDSFHGVPLPAGLKVTKSILPPRNETNFILTYLFSIFCQ